MEEVQLERGEMTCREAGQLGGVITKGRHGLEHYRRAGKLGGAATARTRGPAFYSEIGRKGGAAMKRLYGHEYFSRIGALGAKGRKRQAQHSPPNESRQVLVPPGGEEEAEGIGSVVLPV